MKLTKRTLDAARAKGTNDRVLWDETLPRFGARIRTTGSVTFIVRYRLAGC